MNPETYRKLRRMRLPAFAKAYQEQAAAPELYASLTFDERLTLLVDTEFDNRMTNKIKRLLRDSGCRIFPHIWPGSNTFRNGIWTKICFRLYRRTITSGKG